MTATEWAKARARMLRDAQRIECPHCRAASLEALIPGAAADRAEVAR